MAEADSIVKRFREVKARQAPAELTEAYIAFFREQTAHLDDIEGLIMRLEELMKPRKSQQIIKATVLEKIEPPSRRSTWIIVYIILGFLALISILFFLRWYGKGADEKMTRQN